MKLCILVENYCNRLLEIMKDMREAWTEMYNAWKDAGKKKKKNNKKSYWDQKNGNN